MADKLSVTAADEMLDALVGKNSTFGGTDENRRVALHTSRTIGSATQLSGNGYSHVSVDPDDWTKTTVSGYRRIANTNELSFGDPTAVWDIDQGAVGVHEDASPSATNLKFQVDISPTNPTASTSGVTIPANGLYYEVKLEE